MQVFLFVTQRNCATAQGVWIHFLQGTVSNVYLSVEKDVFLKAPMTFCVFQLWPTAARPTSVGFQRSERKLSTPCPPAPWVCQSTWPGHSWLTQNQLTRKCSSWSFIKRRLSSVSKGIKVYPQACVLLLLCKHNSDSVMSMAGNISWYVWKYILRSYSTLFSSQSLARAVHSDFLYASSSKRGWLEWEFECAFMWVALNLMASNMNYGW